MTPAARALGRGRAREGYDGPAASRLLSAWVYQALRCLSEAEAAAVPKRAVEGPWPWRNWLCDHQGPTPASVGTRHRYYSTGRLGEIGQERSGEGRRTRFRRRRRARSPSTYRDKDEVVEELESAAGECGRSRPPEGRFLVVQDGHLATRKRPGTEEERREGPVAGQAFTNIAQPTPARRVAHDRRRAAGGHGLRLAEATQNTGDAADGHPKHSQLLVRPATRRAERAHPRAPNHHRRGQAEATEKSVDEDTTPPGTSVMSGGERAAEEVRASVGRQSPAVDIAKFFRGDSGDARPRRLGVGGRANSAATTTRIDEDAMGTDEVDNEKAEPASIDGEYRRRRRRPTTASRRRVSDQGRPDATRVDVPTEELTHSRRGKFGTW